MKNICDNCKFKEFVKMIASSEAELLAPGFKRKAIKLLAKKDSDAYGGLGSEMDTNSMNYNNL